MSDYTVIADVSDALTRVLWEEIQGDPQVSSIFNNDPQNISLESPRELADSNNTTVRVSVFLYRVIEDAYSKNQPPLPDAGRRLRRTPLALDLFYLVTPLVGPPREQQIVLGKVMQVFYDRALLEGADLSPAMAAANEELRIALNPVTLEEATRVWEALQLSYRLSVCYVVRVTLLESTRSRIAQPVVAHASDYGAAAEV